MEIPNQISLNIVSTPISYETLIVAVVSSIAILTSAFISYKAGMSGVSAQLQHERRKLIFDRVIEIIVFIASEDYSDDKSPIFIRKKDELQILLSTDDRATDFLSILSEKNPNTEQDWQDWRGEFIQSAKAYLKIKSE